jgi:hypothetical protein
MGGFVLSDTDVPKEDCLAVARQQGAPSWELRAATSLAELCHGHGKGAGFMRSAICPAAPQKKAIEGRRLPVLGLSDDRSQPKARSWAAEQTLQPGTEALDQHSTEPFARLKLQLSATA